MTFCYVDTETLGLRLGTHDIWELAWAIGDDEVQSGFLVHDPAVFEEKALEVNRYRERMTEKGEYLSTEFEDQFFATLEMYRRSGAAVVLVGANPSFDAYRLADRWDGAEPWHYRMLDIGVYAMPYMERHEPQGLLYIANTLRRHGHDIPEPDHTAAGDVVTVRACHQALRAIYDDMVFW